MVRIGIWICVLFYLLTVAVPGAQAAQAVNPITLYQEAVKVENAIKQGENPASVLTQLESLSDMYTRLDQSKVSQRVEGVNAVTAELLSLKQLFAAVKGPDQQVAEFRMHRVVIAFDSMAYPNSPAWLPVARTMENNLEKLIEATAKQDMKTAKSVFNNLKGDRDQIWLALQLHGNPSDLNLQQTAFRFLDGQFSGTAEKVADKQEVLDALGELKASLGRLTSGMQTVEEPPLLPVLYLTLDPVTYGSVSAALLAWFGWKAYRKKKN